MRWSWPPPWSVRPPGRDGLESFALHMSSLGDQVSVAVAPVDADPADVRVRPRPSAGRRDDQPQPRVDTHVAAAVPPVPGPRDQRVAQGPGAGRAERGADRPVNPVKVE